MKIIHCSDLHLDSPMNTHLTSVQARERNAEICHNFGRLVDYAIDQKVQAVLIAGDLFDGKRVTTRTGNYVLDQIRRAKDIPFFYIRGNHDESTQGFQGEILPVNLKTFGTNWKYWRLKEDLADIVITGVEPDSWGPELYDSLKLPSDAINIVMMHGQAGSQMENEMVCLPALKGKQISYLALGHLHSYQQAPLDVGSSYCYPGCLEGRGWDECGQKGFVLIETDAYGLRSKFVPWAIRELHTIDVDITDAWTITEIRQKMKEASEGIKESDLVRYVLTGTSTLETQKDTAYLLQGWKDAFYHVEILDRSRLTMEEKDYAYDISLKGAYLRAVMKEDYTDEDKEAIIQLGMAALAGEVLP